MLRGMLRNGEDKAVSQTAIRWNAMNSLKTAKNMKNW